MTAVYIVFQTMKLGLYSNNEDVIRWTCRVLTKLAGEAENFKLESMIWQWFTAENGGLSSFLTCLEGKTDLALFIINTIIAFSKNRVVEIFTNELNKIVKEPIKYLQLTSLILKSLAESKIVRDEVIFFVYHE